MNKNSGNLFVLRLLSLWIIVLFLSSFFFRDLFPLGKNHLGGGMQTYLSNPTLWGLINFDGEHYLSIARYGYKPLQFFFFPLYPKVVGIVANTLGGSLINFALVGVALSVTCIGIGLVYFYKLCQLDLSNRESKISVLLLLLFPASFFFISFYTESLFFMLAVLAFYYARKGNWILVALFGILASSSRLVGVILLPALFFELYESNKNIRKGIKNYILLLLIPLGLIAYMYYLYSVTGDPLEFKNQVGIYGEQRSSTIILLPQVLYRYFFKILPHLNSYFPMTFTVLLEFIVGIVFLILCVYSYFKQRKSYFVYLFLGYLIPTLSGSFSSMPRYVIVLFPAFMLISKFVSKLGNKQIFLLLILLFFIQLLSFTLFTRGYWFS